MIARVDSKLRKKIEWLQRRAEGALLPDAVLAREGAHLDPIGNLDEVSKARDPVFRYVRR